MHNYLCIANMHNMSDMLSSSLPLFPSLSLCPFIILSSPPSISLMLSSSLSNYPLVLPFLIYLHLLSFFVYLLSHHRSLSFSPSIPLVFLISNLSFKSSIQIRTFNSNHILLTQNLFYSISSYNSYRPKTQINYQKIIL